MQMHDKNEEKTNCLNKAVCETPSCTSGRQQSSLKGIWGEEAWKGDI